MGCADGRDDEIPVHRVWVDAFGLAAYQTTNAEYRRFLEDRRHPLYHRAGIIPVFDHPQQPVMCVSWFDTIAYAEWLSYGRGEPLSAPDRSGMGSALPAGAAEDLPYPWGNCAPEQIQDYSRRWKTGPEPVGTFFARCLWPNLQPGRQHCTSGAPTGVARITTRCLPIEIRRGRTTGARRASQGGVLAAPY